MVDYFIFLPCSFSKKDFDVMKKAIAILTMQFLEDNENVTVIKQVGSF